MGDALDWYRSAVCDRLNHEHGEGGELDCLLETLHRVRSGETLDLDRQEDAG